MYVRTRVCVCVCARARVHVRVRACINSTKHATGANCTSDIYIYIYILRSGTGLVGKRWHAGVLPRFSGRGRAPFFLIFLDFP